MQNIKIKVILGSTRENRFGDKPANWILEKVKGLEGVEAELLDLRDYPMPFFDEPASPAMSPGYENEVVKKWAAKIGEGDAYVIVAPEYNHGYSAVLKNALDYVYREWNCKAVGFVSYGSALGARAVEQLRQVAVELQMAPIRNSVHLPGPWTFETENGSLKPGSFTPFEEAAEYFLAQLLWWAKALKAAREKQV